MGKEAVTWIADRLQCKREVAMELGRAWQIDGDFEHVRRDHLLKDTFLFYHFVVPIGTVGVKNIDLERSTKRSSGGDLKVTSLPRPQTLSRPLLAQSSSTSLHPPATSSSVTPLPTSTPTTGGDSILREKRTFSEGESSLTSGDESSFAFSSSSSFESLGVDTRDTSDGVIAKTSDEESPVTSYQSDPLETQKLRIRKMGLERELSRNDLMFVGHYLGKISHTYLSYFDSWRKIHNEIMKSYSFTNWCRFIQATGGRLRQSLH